MGRTTTDDGFLTGRLFDRTIFNGNSNGNGLNKTMRDRIVNGQRQRPDDHTVFRDGLYSNAAVGRARREDRARARGPTPEEEAERDERRRTRRSWAALPARVWDVRRWMLDAGCLIAAMSLRVKDQGRPSPSVVGRSLASWE